MTRFYAEILYVIDGVRIDYSLPRVLLRNDHKILNVMTRFYAEIIRHTVASLQQDFIRSKTVSVKCYGTVSVFLS